MSDRPPKFKHRVIVAVLRLCTPLWRLWPRAWRLHFGGVIGSLAYRFSRREREKIEHNLAKAFPELSASAVSERAENCLRHFATVAMDTLTLPVGKRGSMIDNLDFSGIQSALDEGKGAILLTGHIGNWEFGASICAERFPMTTIAKEIKSRVLNQLVSEKRDEIGLNVLYQDSDFRELAKVLKSNQVLGILPDQDIERMEGVFVDFFGQRAHTPIGPVMLASLTGAPIVPMFCVKTGHRYSCVTHDPIYVEPKVRKTGKLEYYTQVWSDIVENVIRDYPEQWVWMHNRWKTRESTP